MNEVVMPGGAEPRKILQTAIDEEVSAIMSYSSNGKWHAEKVLLSNLGASRLTIKVSLSEKPHPINIRVNQQVGISIKYGYGKFIFETTVIGLEPSLNPKAGGTIALAVPDRLELVQRRSYFRVELPPSLKVNTMLWHRYRCHTDSQDQIPPEHHWQGQLIDISAGGAQVTIDAEQKPDFKRGQFLRMRFTPMPYETPLTLNTQVRSMLPTADNKSICLGLQIVGLEASTEGQQLLLRLVKVVEQYHQINQSGVKQHDMEPIGPQINAVVK